MTDTFHNGDMIKNDTWCNEKMDKGDAPSGENLKNHDTKNDTLLIGNIITMTLHLMKNCINMMLSPRRT